MDKEILLKEKYKVENELWKESGESIDKYFEIIEKEVNDLYKSKGWEIKIATIEGKKEELIIDCV